MEIQHIQYMKELMNAQGVPVHVIKPPYEDMHLFDAGLRQHLYVDYNYAEITEQLRRGKERTVYFLTDSFDLHYIFFKQPGEIPSENHTFILVGPYLTHDYQIVLQEVSRRMVLPPLQIRELKEYYIGTPKYDYHDSPESKVLVAAGYIFGGNHFDVDRSSLMLKHDHETLEIKLEQDLLLSYLLIEERYGIEDALLAAVGKGDYKQALAQKNLMHKYQLEPRNTDSLRNSKNMCITFNSLLRKAVQQAAVHPAHIDSLSADFARSIEAAGREMDLDRIMDDMVRKYCRLVQNHSLGKYSKNVQKAMNYIDFHYTEQIRLQLLADIASTNANYLSTQFKKETGSSVIEYINELRIRHSLPLLATTDLSIGIIAGKVGFLDDNYYTRTFRKLMNQSPREYRKSLRKLETPV